MKRPEKDLYFMAIAHAVSLRSPCISRNIGCVIVDRHYHILSTGYNGPASGQIHCNPCRRIKDDSGFGLDNCVAVHAEQNALLQCPDVKSIYRIYTSVSPCIHCVKLLMNTSCLTVCYVDEYPNNDLAKKLWKNTGRTWEQLSITDEIRAVFDEMTALRELNP